MASNTLLCLTLLIVAAVIMPMAGAQDISFAVHGFCSVEMDGAKPANADNIRAIEDADPDLTFDTGNMIKQGGTSDDYKYWNVFRELISPIFSYTSSYLNSNYLPAIGRNEKVDDEDSRFFDVFPFLKDLGVKKHYHSADNSGIHFIILDTHDDDVYKPGTEQYGWLQDDLQASLEDKNTRYTVVILHDLPYSDSSGGDSKVRDYLVPLFESYKVDLVFGGQDMIYDRTCALQGGACTDDGDYIITPSEKGVTYIMTGGCGYGKDSLDGRDSFSRAKTDEYHFVEVRVSGEGLNVTAISNGGNVLDSFRIEKNGDVSELACSNVGGIWLEGSCCGDDIAEFYSGGTDGTYACCTTRDECVIGGSCQQRPVGDTELCDGVDNDCDGTVDENLNIECSSDNDCPQDACSGGVWRDYSCTSPGTCISACGYQNIPGDEDGDGFSAECQGDCNDTESYTYPGAPEICDLQDNDCDGTVDEGFGILCSAESDCPSDGCVNGEYRDYRCPDAGTCLSSCTYDVLSVDNDGDGFQYHESCAMESGFDCDDSNPDIHPGSQEACNGLDDDCDGRVDEDIMTSTGCGNTNIGACNIGYRACDSGVWGICIDMVLPTVEQCDGVDNDCDGFIDEDLTVYTGTDQGECSQGKKRCMDGQWIVYYDEVGPSDEVCDGKDNDCDGEYDEVCPCVEGDTASCGDSEDGICESGIMTCEAGSWGECKGGKSPCGGTWDNPKSSCEESCNLKDDDCDGETDEELSRPCGGSEEGICEFGTSACVSGQWSACTGGVGPCGGTWDSPLVPCKDGCDGVDNDCDGRVDEEFDKDLDGFTTCNSLINGSVGNPDCDDSNPDTYPDAPEVCDGEDNDCDGRVDETFQLLGEGCGLGSCNGFFVCAGNGSAVECLGGSPGPELCDGIDNDCDGTVDEGFRDFDMDGHTECTDCDDMNASIHPGAPELCNGIDDNCDGTIDNSQLCEPGVFVITEKYKGRTTDFSSADLSDVDGLVLENPDYGRIEFEEPVSFSVSVNLDFKTNISDNMVYVDSSALPMLNKKATITLYNIDKINPVIIRDGSACPQDECPIISYIGGNLSFRVPHFTRYSAESACTDGTLFGQCSETMPYFCQGGVLIKRCGQCGCPEDLECSDGNCVTHQNTEPHGQRQPNVTYPDCEEGPIPISGCDCSGTVMTYGYCCQDGFQEGPCSQFPWWILVAMGIAIIAVVLIIMRI